MVTRVLLLALIIVESNGNNNAVNGDAAGCLQITPVVVKDVNRFAGTKFTLQDRFDRDKSIRMAELYLKYYGRIYIKKTGKVPDNEVLARIWNGGPNGWKKSSTQDFWLKVKKEIEKQPQDGIGK
jgi:soluble lytic murein transglycosylase-like protein